MTTFTIDNENSITAFASPEEAATATSTPFDTFASEKDLARLVANWPPERLVATWNCLPGVTPVKGFKSAKSAAGKIWKRVQSLASSNKAGKPAPKATPKPATKGTAAPRKPRVAPERASAGKKATPAKKGSQGKKAAKPAKKESAAREGSKTERVLELLKGPGGATLNDLMTATGWQRHSVRGFISGALGKKMGLEVVSTKREDGERVYSIAK